MRNRRVAVLLIAVAVATGLASTVAAGTQTSRAPAASLRLKIGALLAQTGTSGVYGPSWLKSVNMAVGVINSAAKKAGVDFQVSLDTADNQSDPVATVSAAQKLVADGATCLVGTSSSATTTSAATSVAIPQGIPLIAPSSTSSSVTALHAQGGLTFRTVAADPLEASGLARVISQRLKGAKGKLVSVAGRNDVYGQGLTGALSKAWEKLGGKVQGPLLYDPNAANYDSEAQQIVSGSPKAFVIIDLPGTYGKVASALLRTGKWSTSDSFIAGGYPSPIPSGIPPETLNGITGVSPGFPRSGKLVTAFNGLWNRSGGTSQQQSYDQNMFDAMILCALGSLNAHSTNGRAIAAALPKVNSGRGPQYTFLTLTQAMKKIKTKSALINYEGVSGPIDWDKNGDIKQSFINVYQYVNNILVVRGVIKP
jgi:branched-chain amino acid transport system substrate-binding protein